MKQLGRDYNKDKAVSVLAVRDIAAHEDICINYHGDHDSESTTWFTKRDIAYHSSKNFPGFR